MAVVLDHLLLGLVGVLDTVRGNVLGAHQSGRTIRQFIVGVIVIPTTVSLLWFSIFGGAGIGRSETESISRAGVPGSEVVRDARQSPARRRSTVLVMLLVAMFFVSGADAASMVMGTLSQRGLSSRVGGSWCSGVC